jgi:hypothetical protein
MFRHGETAAGAADYCHAMKNIAKNQNLMGAGRLLPRAIGGLVLLSALLPCPEPSAQSYSTGYPAAEERKATRPTPVRTAATRPAPSPTVCLVSSFRSMALTVHHPEERRTRAMQWLDRHKTVCGEEQLININNSLGLWLGTSATPELEALLDGYINVKAQARIAAAAKAAEPPKEESN